MRKNDFAEGLQDFISFIVSLSKDGYTSASLDLENLRTMYVNIDFYVSI